MAVKSDPNWPNKPDDQRISQHPQKTVNADEPRPYENWSGVRTHFKGNLLGANLLHRSSHVFPGQKKEDEGTFLFLTAEHHQPQWQVIWGEQQVGDILTQQLDSIRRIDRLEREIKAQKAFFKVNHIFINTLNDSKWELKETLAIAIEQRSKDDFVASLYDLDLYGYGENIPEALEDLNVSIINQFEYLSSKKDEVELSEKLKNQLDFLKKVMILKNA